MNVFIVFFVVVLTIAVIGFLISRKCRHSWQNIDQYDSRKYKIFVQRCSKCGNLRTKKLKVR